MPGLSYFEAGVLAAIYRGVNTLKDLKELFHTVDPRIVEQTVKRLEERGLIKRVPKGRILKREELVLTEAGVKVLDEAMGMLREAAAKLESRPPNTIQPSWASWDLAAIIPLLILMGLIPPIIVDEYAGWTQDSGDESTEGEYSEWNDYDYDVGIDSLDI